MANDVYANGREISCKAADGKSICAFPDVCLTPPPPPAGYIPVPYPNTAFASDATNGSRTVQISGKEVMLKNKSYFKKSTGDEAATRGSPMGVLTHTITGKAYFTSWSMDVKIEGENVDRHLDLTTHNHQSFPSNTTTWPYADSAAFAPGGPCSGVKSKFQLVPYKSKDPDTKEEVYTCAPKTGHHIIPGRCMRMREFSADGDRLKEPAYPTGCSHDKAPCVCVDNENQYDGTHRDCHAIFDPVEQEEALSKGHITYKKARDTAAKSTQGINNGKEPTEKEQECVKAQLDNYYKNCLTNQDGSVALNSKLKAQSDNSGLVLDGAVD